MLDLNYLKSKLNSLNSATAKRTGTDQSVFWKPTGTHSIRIIPYIHDLKSPFLEIYNYYNFGNRKVITSPISFGMPDPIFEFAQKLQGTGNRDDYGMGKRLEPKRRTHVWILVRGQEHEGPKLWGFSDTVYKEILSTMLDPDYGNVLDASEGRDLVVEFTPRVNENAFEKTVTRFKPITSPLTNDPAVIELIKAMPKIESICKAPSYDELREILEEHLGANDDTSASDNGQSQSAVKVQSAPANSAGADLGSIFNTQSNVQNSSNGNEMSPNVQNALSEFERLFSTTGPL